MLNAIVPSDDHQWQFFKFGEQDVRATCDDNNDPILVFADVCAALGISQVRDALERIPETERGMAVAPSPGGPQRMHVVREPGLYRLIFRSNKPDAKKFQDLVFNKILPAIRKTGSYSITQTPPTELDIVEGMVKALRAYQTQTDAKITELYEKQANETVTRENEVAEIKAALLDKDYHTILQWCRSQKINSSESIRNGWGRRATELSRELGVEIKSVNEEGPYPIGRYHKSILLQICRPVEKKSGQLPLEGL